MKPEGMPAVILASLLLHLSAVAVVMQLLSRDVQHQQQWQNAVFVDQLVTEEGPIREPRQEQACQVRQAPAAATATTSGTARPAVGNPLATTAARQSTARLTAPSPVQATVPHLLAEAPPTAGARAAAGGAAVAAKSQPGITASAAVAGPDGGRLQAAGAAGANAKERGGHGTAGRAAASRNAAGTSMQRGSYLALLKRMIEARKQYPLASRRRGEEGTCQRRIVLARDGSLRRVETVSRCGYPFLDEAATRAVTSAGKFPPLPDSIDGAEAAFTVAITFALGR